MCVQMLWLQELKTSLVRKGSEIHMRSKAVLPIEWCNFRTFSRLFFTNPAFLREKRVILRDRRALIQLVPGQAYVPRERRREPMMCWETRASLHVVRKLSGIGLLTLLFSFSSLLVHNMVHSEPALSVFSAIHRLISRHLLKKLREELTNAVGKIPWQAFKVVFKITEIYIFKLLINL